MSNMYSGVRRIKEPIERKRAAERLLRMRATLRDLRAKRKDSSILLATWNIRDFGANKFNPSPRRDETFYYLAEVASCFDLIALQEVNRNLSDFERLTDILGRNWGYILTDATEGHGGNGERMAFLYNRDKVWFRNIAGEIVLPQGQLIVPRSAVEPPATRTVGEATLVPEVSAATAGTAIGQQFARTPFLVAFQAGWFKFNLCTVHIYYGEESGPALQRRIAEIEALVAFFAKRQDAENRGVSPLAAENYILLGDFNVVSPDHQTMQALAAKKFRVPEQIDGEHLADRDHFYDQIAVRVRDPRFKVLDGGIVDLYQDVFTEDDVSLYEVPAKVKGRTPLVKFRTWRTWQMSDHSPLWVEIQTDFTDSYLGDIT